MSKASRKFKVPDELANLYDFANSLDQRRFADHGVRHQPHDELGNPRELGAWMAERGLMPAGGAVDEAALESAVALRAGLRDYLEREPEQRRLDAKALRGLNARLAAFPLRVEARPKGIGLRPAGSGVLSALSALVAELYDASASGKLDRLKMCASEECRRVFYDRSKPGTRRWCQASLCGNRMKTRNYRKRQRQAP